MAAEKEIRITSKDEGIEIVGRLDLLVFSPEFWLLCIETKSVQYSIEVGIPQILTYMLAMMEPQQQGYGMVTNGTDFIFVKCDRGTDPPPHPAMPYRTAIPSANRKTNSSTCYKFYGL